MSRSQKAGWTAEVKFTQEDEILTELVAEHGLKSWSTVSKKLSKLGQKERSGKQCRERWLNQIDPTIKTDNWTLEEAEKIFAYAKVFGKKWSQVAIMLPGRTENAIKNYFYSTVRKNIRRVNKRLAFGEKIQGSVDELMNDVCVSEFVFCSARSCLRKIEEMKCVGDAFERMQEVMQNGFYPFGDGLDGFGIGLSGIWRRD